MDRWIGSKDDFKRFEGFKWYVWWELNMYIYIFSWKCEREKCHRMIHSWIGIHDIVLFLFIINFFISIIIRTSWWNEIFEGKVNSNKQHACSSLSIVLARLASYFELRITRGLKEVDKKSSIIISKRDKSELYRFPSPALDTRAKARLSRK